MSPAPQPPTIDTGRVVADLRELAARTGDERGAQRLCWSEGWDAARGFLRERLGELDLEPELDEAANLWAHLEGERDGPALALGSHLDSVPDGGWLDGALGVMAALGVVRSWVEAGRRPTRALALVDWADEEGARFGRSLFGSSAFSGSLSPAELDGLRDAEGREIAEVLAQWDVELGGLPRCAQRRDGIGAYLELHIEQGPRMEAKGMRAAAVAGCAGVERLRFEFAGQASHAGTTPMEMRRDAGLAAASAALAIERIPQREGGVATTGELALAPGIPTAVPGAATLTVDLRHPHGEELARMLDAARSACEQAARDRGCELTETPVWRIEPIAFDPELVAMARDACEAAGGAAVELTSGALHDAAEAARVLPAAMVFAPSKAGISHDRAEDTDERDLVVAIEAFGLLAGKAVAR